MTRTLAAVAVVSIAALAGASPALGATPFTAGNGAGHDLAVGSDGKAHLAWIEAGADDSVTYCRVPVGGAACEITGTLHFPGAASTGLGSVQVFAPQVDTVVVLAGCTQCSDGAERAFRWISAATNGASFGAAADVGDMRFGGHGDYIGSNNVLGVNGGRFQAMATTVAPLTLGDAASFVYSPSAVRGGASEAVFAVNNLSAVRYRVFNGALDPNTMNNEAVAPNWSGNLALASPEADNEETHLSSGGNGVLLSYLSSFSPADVRVGLRVFDSATDSFGAPVYLEGASAVDANGLDFPHHSQDPGNRIHLVWRTLHDGGRLRYIRSDDGGASFSAPANLALGESFQDPIVEAGPAGTGFAAWRTTGSAVRIVPIDPQPEPAAPGGSGGPGGPGVTDTERPGVGSFGIADSTLTPGAGTEFSFTSTEAGRAVLTIQKRVKGLKVTRRGRRRCVPQTRRRLRRAPRRRHCRTWKRIGRIRREVLRGPNTIVWNGRVAGRRLGPGLYRARLVIADATGNVSRTETIRFRVRRRVSS